MKPCPKQLAVLLSLIGLNLSWGTAAHADETTPAPSGGSGADDVIDAPLADADVVAHSPTARVVAYSGSLLGAQQRARIAHLRANLGLAPAPVVRKSVRHGQRFVRVAAKSGARQAARAKPLVAIRPIPQPDIQVRSIAAKPFEARPIHPATPAELTADYLDPLMPFLRTLAAAETRQQAGAFTGEFDLPIASEVPRASTGTLLASIEDVFDPIDYGPPVAAVASSPMASTSAAIPDVADSAEPVLAAAAPDREADADAATPDAVVARSMATTIVMAEAPVVFDAFPVERPLADWPWLQSPDGRASAALVIPALKPPVPIRIAPEQSLSAGFDIFDRDLPAPRASATTTKAQRVAGSRSASRKLTLQAPEERQWIDIFDPRLASSQVVDGKAVRSSRFEPIVAMPAPADELAWYDIFEPLGALTDVPAMPVLATIDPTPLAAADASTYDIFDAGLLAPPTTFDNERLAKLELAIATGRAMLATRDDVLADFRAPAIKRPLEPKVQVRVERDYNAIVDAMQRVALATPRAPVEIPLATENHVASGFDDEPRTLLDGTLVAVATEKLDELRGGFEGDGGLKISFGIERAVYINGALVTTTSLNVADLSKLTGGAALGTVISGGSMGLIQNGPGNSFQMGQISASTVGTVIQNTLNDQNIQGVTMINATVNSLDLVKSSSIQSNIRSAITDSIRR